MSSKAGMVVCVTGGSGFIGSWLVKLLLLRGYTVKATVLNANDPKEVDHLLKFDGAKERLQLFQANLMEQGSFDSAVHGCEGVFHLASPCCLDAQDPQAQIIDPAVKGTLNVLKSCAKSSSLKRVVLTSSIVAMIFNGKPKAPQDVVDETWFSNPDICNESKMWYSLSKTLAEEAAWKFVKENKIDMITINPGMVIGPMLQPALNFSASLIFNLINGAETFPNRIHGWVNVKDVANAHIQAFEISSASGRYCLTESVAHYTEIVEILHHLYPTLQLPHKCENDEPFMPKYQISKQKAKTLGIEFIPFKVSLKEIVESLKANKFIEF